MPVNLLRARRDGVMRAARQLAASRPLLHSFPVFIRHIQYGFGDSQAKREKEEKAIPAEGRGAVVQSTSGEVPRCEDQFLDARTRFSGHLLLTVAVAVATGVAVLLFHRDLHLHLAFAPAWLRV